MKRAEERLDLLDMTKAERAKVAAVLKEISESTGTLKESVPTALQALKDGIQSAKIDEILREQLNGVITHVDEAITAARMELVSTVESLEAEIANRFDTAMDRVVGWYVRRTKFWLFVIGFCLAAVTNFDVIGYAGDLVKNEDLRAKIVAQAAVIGNTAKFIDAKTMLDPAPEQTETEDSAQPTFEGAAKKVNTAAMNAMKSLQYQLGDQGVTLGWSCEDDQAYCQCFSKNFSLMRLLSWLLIGIACTMGGPFWYDALKKLLSVRAMVAPTPAPQTENAG